LPSTPGTAALAQTEKQQPDTLAQGVLRSILTYIRDNGLKVGENILSEGEFAQQLGVSRTVVREAFKALAAMNVIEVGAGRRARVSAFDGSVMALALTHALRTEQLTVQQVWDVRRGIEMRTVELACMHRSDRDAERIVDLARRIRESIDDIPTMTDHDIAFHVAIAGCTRNPLYPVLISSLTSVMRETNPIAMHVLARMDKQSDVVDWHAAIAGAIRDRDTDRAIAMMARHFEEATLGLVNSGFN